MTGWLPETFCLDKDADVEALWAKMLTGSRSNSVLITISTSSIADEDAVGLVGGHAYAVLEVVEVLGLRMLLIKNPWGHYRWKGRYSYDDKKSWTP